MKTSIAIAIGAVVSMFATPIRGLAAPVLDQAFAPTSWTISGSIGLQPATYFGQSFTAGKTGKLSQVRLEIQDAPQGLTSPPLRISVFSAPNGLPASFPLTAVDLVDDHLTLLKPIAFALPIDVVAGDQYLISAHYPSLTHSLYEHSNWMGGSSDGYAGGAAFTGRADQSGSLVWEQLKSSRVPRADFSFETYVDTEPVPEPAALHTAAVALGIIGSALRSFLHVSRKG